MARTYRGAGAASGVRGDPSSRRDLTTPELHDFGDLLGRDGPIPRLGRRLLALAGILASRPATPARVLVRLAPTCAGRR